MSKSSSKEKFEDYNGKKFIIYCSNKLKPPLNASKKTQNIRAGFLKNLRNT